MLTQEQRQENKEKFVGLLRMVKREGIEKLIDWLETTDFFEAPASTKYHLSEKGGLCQHSLDVYQELIRIKRAYPEIPMTHETAIIISLLHDLCKANLYGIEKRNRKLDSGEWVKVDEFAYKEQFAFGYHGPKSMYLAMKYIQLTDDEAVAIANHMGASLAEKPERKGDVYKKCLTAWLLHIADESATYVVEEQMQNEEGNA